MKLIVREHIIAIAEPVKKVFNVTIDAINAYGKIPASIGMKKGDLIVFRGEGDPVRLAAGNVDGRILVTDHTSETGWSIVPNSSASGNSVSLNNITGTLVKGGTVVKISSGHEFVKATSADTSMLFVTADDCPAGEDVVCYGVANTICSVMCSAAAVTVGDELGVSATDGIAETVQNNGFAKALTAKASGSTGTVEAIIIQNNFLSLRGGELIGNLDMADTRIHANSESIKEDTAPLTTIWYAPLEFYDKDGNLIGHIEFAQDTSNRLRLQFGIRRKINGSWVWKQVYFTVDPNGNIAWDFGDVAAALTALGINNSWTKATTAAAALTALGAFPASGGTLTGNWIIRHSGMDSAANSRSSNQYAAQGVQDPNGKYLGYIQTVQQTDGRTMQQMSARHYTSGNNYVDNVVAVGVNADGSRFVNLSEAGPWRTALGITGIALRPDYSISTSAPSTLATGKLHFVYKA